MVMDEWALVANPLDWLCAGRGAISFALGRGTLWMCTHRIEPAEEVLQEQLLRGGVFALSQSVLLPQHPAVDTYALDKVEEDSEPGLACSAQNRIHLHLGIVDIHSAHVSVVLSDLRDELTSAGSA